MDFLLILFCIAGCVGLVRPLFRKTTHQPHDGSPEALVAPPDSDVSCPRNLDHSQDAGGMEHSGRRKFAACAFGVSIPLLCVEPFFGVVAIYAGLAALSCELEGTDRKRVFRQWVLALSVVWLCFSLHFSWGGLNPNRWNSAGFPWPFCFWQYGELVKFNFLALLGNVGLGFVTIIGVAGACAWSRGSHPK